MNRLSEQHVEKASDTLVYVIDQDFRIVYSNDEKRVPRGYLCHEVIGKNHRQCTECPFHPKNQGRATLYNHLHEEWVTVRSAPIQWPGNGACQIILSDRIGVRDGATPNSTPKTSAQAASTEDLRDKQGFFDAVDGFLRTYQGERTWCLLSIDIENLKLFNKWYGWKAGNALIAGMYEHLSHTQTRLGGVAGYFGNDDFALLMPYKAEWIDAIYQGLKETLISHSNKEGFLPAIGVYEITDRSMPTAIMFDWAELARAQVRGNYLNRVVKFDSDMRNSLEAEINLFSEVRKALDEREFTFYLQPKCNMKNGKLVGAEALVRWISRANGVVPPGVFIPFLEKTGFITELDVYIWEEVCKWLRGALDRGEQVVPISVNISRTDLYAIDVPALFRELIRKYHLSPQMVELEITESVYTESSDHISKTVSELRGAGFRVLMDDFGSGYSSLNMLKDIEVDVLKVDMRFLEIDQNNHKKGIGILEMIHNMAKLMGMEVIVEGVETEEQKAFLLNMGCGYGQGYYFYRPMPLSEFDQLLRDEQKLAGEEFQDSVSVG